MLKGIRHIIFDLGGVLINLDYTLTEKAFVDLGIENFQALYSQMKQTSLFDDLETGVINRDKFVAGIKEFCSAQLNDQQICTAWNAMLLDFPLRRLQLLQQLRPYFDLVLLSNTNEIHEEAFNKLLHESYGVNLATYFDKVYYSHKVGMRKPDTQIFKKILDENGFEPIHTLFIDDSPQHIESAKTLGIQTIFLQPGMTIEKDVFLPKTSK
ncbi:MAG TPA: HAD family phosphatase [Flavipsychrobacter sp.]|nr:HAD family phosphatase [Flavipsychrobacter sp.]